MSSKDRGDTYLHTGGRVPRAEHRAFQGKGAVLEKPLVDKGNKEICLDDSLTDRQADR